MSPPLALLTLAKATDIVVTTLDHRLYRGQFMGFESDAQLARTPDELPGIRLRFYPERTEITVAFDRIAAFAPLDQPETKPF